MFSKEKLWSLFEAGEYLSNKELEILMADAKLALKYLNSRKDYALAVAGTTRDLEALKSCWNSRLDSNTAVIRKDNGELFYKKMLTKEEFHNSLIKVCQVKNINVDQLSEITGVSRPTAERWLAKETAPHRFGRDPIIEYLKNYKKV